jgi:hypothetical protein
MTSIDSPRRRAAFAAQFIFLAALARRVSLGVLAERLAEKVPLNLIGRQCSGTNGQVVDHVADPR